MRRVGACSAPVACGLLVAEHGLWGTGAVVVVQALVAAWHVASSRTRDQTCVPGIGRQILNHWTTREAQSSLKKQFSLYHLSF